ncbi:MAG: SUMF1/EgtB/PvdO family nonheme iron enzyme [Deltaproteobacteria bacterium]|nr:SUMF1/EgtB/PvdO family nonheme iron enzyme [Deltaproteobacteria bacterium]
MAMRLAIALGLAFLITVCCTRSRKVSEKDTAKEAPPAGEESGGDRGSSKNNTGAVLDGSKRSDRVASADADNNSANRDGDPSISQPQIVDEPIDLKPSADCIHPDVKADCGDGFCRIPAGCYIMGARRDETFTCMYSCVQVQVTLTRDFLIGETEVTREQWKSVGWEFPERNINMENWGECLDPECPVSNVTVFDAMAFSNRYSELRGLKPCYEFSGCSGEIGKDYFCDSIVLSADSAYECEGYRLPYEAEWEYAARAGTRTAYYSGDIAPSDVIDCYLEPNLEDISWYCWNAGNRVHEVGKKKPNPWGLYDVLGNVAEWTNDIFRGAGYGQGPLVDPPGVLTPGRVLREPTEMVVARVTRGGSINFPVSNTVWRRNEGTEGLADVGSGFRLVRTIIDDRN